MSATHSPLDTQLAPSRAPYLARLAVTAAIAALSLSAAVILIAMPGHGQLATGDAQTAIVYFVAYSLWVLMSVAMMLPTAWGFVMAYLDIAHAAREKAVRVPPVAALVTGYLAVWAGFSAVAAAVQIGLQSSGFGPSAEQSIDPVLGGALMVAAGLYELSPLKAACLSKCRHPFAVLLGRFRPDAGRIFRLGAEQGLFCVGCCWALMALMLAAGVVHLSVMAILAAVMAAQKHWNLRQLDKPFGVALVAGGLALLAWSGA